MWIQLSLLGAEWADELVYSMLNNTFARPQIKLVEQKLYMHKDIPEKAENNLLQLYWEHKLATAACIKNILNFY